MDAKIDQEGYKVTTHYKRMKQCEIRSFIVSENVATLLFVIYEHKNINKIILENIDFDKCVYPKRIYKLDLSCKVEPIHNQK